MSGRFNGGPAVRCEECGRAHPRKAQRLNPRNLRPEYRLLCDGCRSSLGFTLVSYDRSPANHALTSLRRHS